MNFPELNSLLLPGIVFAGTAVVALVVFLVLRAVVGRKAEKPLDVDAQPLGFLVKADEPTDAVGQMDRGFEHLVVGTGTGMTTGQALGIMAVSGIVFASVPIIWRDDFALAIFGLVAGLLLPLAVFYLMYRRYRAGVQAQLPDAFFLIARSLRAGLNLEQSLATVARYGTAPLSNEFKQVVDQIDLGLAVPAAVQGMARRLNMTDIDVLATAVTLHRTIGGNLALLLERVATGTRDRNLFRGYFWAATALARITGITIALAPPLLLLGYWVWQPEFIARFISTASGLRALGAAVVLEVIGAIWLFFLLQVDY